MDSKSVKISKAEYEEYQHLKKVEWEIVGEFKQGLEDLKKGKFIEC
ncbi:hypothetical protein HOA92_07070 [archaeon]|jgi:hypothetical protein|nr:hypothetical protein [archaeon]MBT6762773.1 hypothetical protein [archaeon]